VLRTEGESVGLRRVSLRHVREHIFQNPLVIFRRMAIVEIDMQSSHVIKTTGNASAYLLGQRDDDALRATDVTEPVFVLVLRQLADEFSAVGL
jgi:hypothetical protein